MRFVSLTVSLLALASLAALPVAAQEMIAAPPPPLRAGTHAPPFASRTLDGKRISLRSLRGKVVLLDFWATWCGPCRMSIPGLVSLQRQFQPRRFTVVGISMDEADTRALVKPFAQKMQMVYPIALSLAANASAQKAYHAETLPSQYLIDRHGVVRWSQIGYSPDDRAELARRIQRLLAER